MKQALWIAADQLIGIRDQCVARGDEILVAQADIALAALVTMADLEGASFDSQPLGDRIKELVALSDHTAGRMGIDVLTWLGEEAETE